MGGLPGNREFSWQCRGELEEAIGKEKGWLLKSHR